MPQNCPLEPGHIPRAKVEITDQMLDAFTEAAEKAVSNEGLNAAEAALLLQYAGPIGHELRQRRGAMDLIHSVTTIDNVVFLGPCE